MTRPLLLLAVMFTAACGGSAKSTSTTGAPPPNSANDSRAEIDKLDQDITAKMAKLSEPRPAAPLQGEPASDPVRMATQANAPDDPNMCKPAKTATCTESCELKTSICDNAARICTIANNLGGADSYANEKCSSGSASCEAAKKRCCSCM